VLDEAIAAMRENTTQVKSKATPGIGGGIHLALENRRANAVKFLVSAVSPIGCGR
jgi:hypothetical protein